MKCKGIWVAIACILVIGTGATYSTRAYVKNLEQMEKEEARLQSFAVSGSGAFETSPEAGAGSRMARAAEGGAVAAEKERGMGGLELENEARSGSDPSRDIGREKQASETKTESAEDQPAGEPFSLYLEQEQSPAGSQPEPPAAESRLRAAVPSSGLEETGIALASELPESDTAFADQAPGPGSTLEADSGQGEERVSPISPLEGAKGRKIRLEVDYRQKLEELDTQISRMREGETDSNVYSVKTSAETELKMWEGEMGAVYSALLERSTEEEAKKIASEQQEWLKNRDAEAAKASGKTGSSVERASYSAALASLTRERAYELTGLYEEANGVKEEESTAG